MTAQETDNPQPLRRLISGRYFDDFQDGLRSRYEGQPFDYELTYHALRYEQPFVKMTFTGPKYLGQVIAWEDGAMTLKIELLATGKPLFIERWQVYDEVTFYSYAAIPMCIHDLYFFTEAQAFRTLRTFIDSLPERAAEWTRLHPDDGFGYPEIVESWTDIGALLRGVGQTSPDIGE